MSSHYTNIYHTKMTENEQIRELNWEGVEHSAIFYPNHNTNVGVLAAIDSKRIQLQANRQNSLM